MCSQRGPLLSSRLGFGVSYGGIHKMKITGPGEFSVSPGEQITVSIEKSVAPYSAKVSELTDGSWNPKPEPNNVSDLSAAGGFACPANSGDSTSFGILFNFVPTPTAEGGSGDFYKVTIAGSNGGESPQLIFGPGFTTRTYHFEVQ